jgi:hypothetical protein
MTTAAEPPTTSAGRTGAVARYAIFPAAVAVLVLTLGTLGLTTSSVGIYGTATGASEAASGTVFGPPRNIRSDEWYVRTPWVLRQGALGYPEEVESAMGTHDVAVLADLPTGGWGLLLRPHSIWYQLTGVERAFALEWWTFAFLQLVGTYALLSVLTRRPLLAALSALLVTLSPATQWWSTPAAFIAIGYGSLAAAAAIGAVRTRRTARRVLLAIGAGLATAGFLATLYVPWQIGTALVLAPVGLAALAAEVWTADDRRRALLRIALVGGIAGAIGLGTFGVFALQHRETFDAVAGTVYPGEQPATEGGSADLRVFWGAAYDSFSSAKTTAEVNGRNQSENGSGLVLLVPVLAAVYALASAGRLRWDPRSLPLAAALMGALVVASWMLLPVPGWIGQFALLTRVNPGRLFLPMSFAGAVALGLLAARLLEPDVRLARWQQLACAAVFALPQAWAAGQYTVDGARIDLRIAVVLLAVVVVGTALALGRRPASGLGVLALFLAWQSSAIVPLQRGADRILESDLHQAVVELDARAAEEADGWAAFDSDPFVKGTLTAAGVNHLTGVSPYPDAEAWRQIDPTGTNEGTWNRYAHISFTPGAAGSSPAFRVLAPDAVAVTLDPCGPDLLRIGTRFVVTQGAPAPSFGCGRAVRRVAHGTGEVVVYDLLPEG